MLEVAYCGLQGKRVRRHTFARSKSECPWRDKGERESDDGRGSRGGVMSIIEELTDRAAGRIVRAARCSGNRVRGRCAGGARASTGERECPRRASGAENCAGGGGCTGWTDITHRVGADHRAADACACVGNGCVCKAS